MKRIVTMQDISCVGKCSLTVALPVLSAMGIETAVLPTAILSTHTMFSDFTFHDLTKEIDPIMNHWQKEQFHFDAVYVGYLGSDEQIQLASDLFHRFGTGLRLLDPCMADNGKLYTGFSDNYVKEIRKLCAEADMIVPNLTEAALLLDIPYQEEYSPEEIKKILKQLTSFGCPTAILTGIHQRDLIGACAYDSPSDTYVESLVAKEPVSFHGTGDLFASTLLGCLMNDLSLSQALDISCHFIQQSIHCTLQEENHNTYGVNFEQAIPTLITELKQRQNH